MQNIQSLRQHRPNMCGIAGFTSFAHCPSDRRGILERMTAALAHRGPDEQGLYLGDGVALGSRRLSIIDLHTGSQPIANEDRSLWIVLNGEIYNYQGLRAQLIAQGHQFTTQTDTEVILHLYEEIGEACVDHLNGMFAFAIWDTNRKTLLLARDRLGIKPLHYIEYPGGLVFASEIKALLRHPACQPRLNFQALQMYLACEYIPDPSCIFQGIRKLQPCHILIHRMKNTTQKAYWTLPEGHKANERPARSVADYAEECRWRLRESVRQRLISDVPVGIFLSGGLDSSTVAVLASQAADTPIQTFSIGFEEPSFDESRYAQRLARHLGTVHHHDILNSRKMLDMLPQIIACYDEPLADKSTIPTYVLSQMTSKTVKVALGGDGADELFAGYPTYQAHKLATYWNRLPSRVTVALSTLLRALPVSHTNMSVDFKIQQFLRGIPEITPALRHLTWMSAFLPSETQQLLLPEIQAQLKNNTPLKEYLPKGQNQELQAILSLSIKLYLQNDILVKVDRASMANSLEVRVPYLDHTFVEFAMQVPAAYKLRGWTTKYLLKQAARDLIPREILRRKKKGFSVPIAKWLAGDLRDMALDYLSEERIRREGLFHYPYIAQLLSDHFSRRQDHRKQLWTLLVFEMWREQYLQ